LSVEWFIQFELTEPIPDNQLDHVRAHLIETLADAGYHAKTTTADWSMVMLARTPKQQLKPPDHYGNIRQVKSRRGVGSRAA
jgi:hypothetical protein